MKYELKKKYSWKYVCEFSKENPYIDKGISFTIYWCSWRTGAKKNEKKKSNGRLTESQGKKSLLWNDVISVGSILVFGAQNACKVNVKPAYKDLFMKIGYLTVFVKYSLSLRFGLENSIN